MSASVAIVAAAADGRALVSLRGGRATVFDAVTLEVTATGAVAEDAAAAALFGAHLVIAHGDRLSVLELPGLTEVSTTTVPGLGALGGVAGERLILPLDGAVALARIGSDGIALEQLAVAGAIEDALALDGERALVFAGGALQIVSVVSHRTLTRVSARVPAAPRLCGVAATHRMVWVARVDDSELTLLRLSDGRTFGYRAAAPITGALGHPLSPWLVVVTRHGLERVHVQTLAGHPMTADLERGACVVGGEHPALCWFDRQGRLRRTPLDGDAVIGPAGFRLAMAANAVASAQPVREPAPAPTTPTATAIAAAIAPHDDDGAAAPAPVPLQRVGRRGRGSALWRVELADWARGVLAPAAALPPDTALPPLTDTPLLALATRLALGDDGVRALALLYGAWLTGAPRPALAALARAVEWDEAGGAGTLPAAGLTTVVGGRVALRTAVARFLDGAAPTRVLLAGAGTPASPPRGPHWVATDPALSLDAAARAVAAALGAAAITDEARAGGRRGLAIALDEAWLRQRPLIALPSGGFDVDALAATAVRPDHALIVVWPDREPPPALASWTTLALPR